MQPQQFEAALTTLEQVFDQEAEYIVRGQLLEIGELSKTKIEHLQAVSDAIEDGVLRGQPQTLVRRVARLQATASEHGQHLQAMQRGLARVLGRLDRLQNDSQVGSYDQYGSKVQFSGATGRFESKA